VADALPLWAFAAVTAPLVLMPGASTAVVLRNSLGGVRGGLLTAVGTNSGSGCYGLLTAFGLGVALQRWPSAWLALRVAGMAYLIWLGAHSLHRAVAPALPHSRGVSPQLASAVAGGWYRPLIQGFLANVLNPFLATFYLVVLPQFIPAAAPFARSALVLTAIHVGMASAWHVTWAIAGGTLARTLSSGRPRQVLEGLTGVALLALAARMVRG
jgi:threonine/homoserine/homoserine lactone efflux protein